jgi:hypothetical protein
MGLRSLSRRSDLIEYIQQVEAIDGVETTDYCVVVVAVDERGPAEGTIEGAASMMTILVLVEVRPALLVAA